MNYNVSSDPWLFLKLHHHEISSRMKTEGTLCFSINIKYYELLYSEPTAFTLQPMEVVLKHPYLQRPIWELCSRVSHCCTLTAPGWKRTTLSLWSQPASFVPVGLLYSHYAQKKIFMKNTPKLKATALNEPGETEPSVCHFGQRQAGCLSLKGVWV